MDIFETICDALDFSSSPGLLSAHSAPSQANATTWIDKGDWLLTAQKAGVEKVFFVENNPVVVFARCPKNTNSIIEAYNRIWCLSRPRLLFLVTEGELSVIDLAQEPIRSKDAKSGKTIRILERLATIKNIAQVLSMFHRDNIESGKIFEDARLESLEHRADQALISDLKSVRRTLLNAGLDAIYAHSLIGRSIFIRYLEDRKILTKEYFSKIAKRIPVWQQLLSEPSSHERLDFSGVQALYPRVLMDKDFTYALFRELSNDFNGDMFPNTAEEEAHVTNEHLQLIQSLLYGDVGLQQKLFFFSYRFDIIPIDLISAIYEEFYHATITSDDEKHSKARQDGAYYTPPVLAEFVLTRILTEEKLKTEPRVLDPACGSGIFLVEAFRRIVRYRILSQKEPVTFNALKDILANQIAGIEVNEEAARITAFSLYLAMLNYLDPPSIMKHITQGNRLPNLVFRGDGLNTTQNRIFVKDTFEIDEAIVGKVDIIVGNPPWGACGNQADEKTKSRQKVMTTWCETRKYPLGDKEPSQAFLWRVLDFLVDGGQCGLLTSAGVLLKNSSTTKEFREKWMAHVCILEVFNFVHVRHYFFKGAVSPFVLINFQKSSQNGTPVQYWSPKQIIAQKKTQSVLVSKYDRSFLVDQNLASNITWKANWFGHQGDLCFILGLLRGKRLEDVAVASSSGQGYMVSSRKYDFSQWASFPTITKLFTRYSSIETKPAPMAVHRRGAYEAYSVPKILVNEGIYEKGVPKGIIIAAYFQDNLSFSESCYSIVLENENQYSYMLILGILWSSFARYYFFLTSANWGAWNHKILLEELFNLPLPDVRDIDSCSNLVAIVERLRNYHPIPQDILHPKGPSIEEIENNRKNLEIELDEAVFSLYGFSEEQRDLIRDCCDVTLPFFYQPYNSIGAMPAIVDKDVSWICIYADIFAKRWQPYLAEDEVMRGDLHLGASGNVIAMEFYPADADDEWRLSPRKDTWKYILDEIAAYMQVPMGTSQILLEGIVQLVTDDSIIIIKRNEKRFWTRSAAREDADSTIAKRMIDTIPSDGEQK